MNIKDLAKAKRNTLTLYATLQKYQMYKRAQAATQGMYEDDFLFYNDTVEQRHERNKKQIKKLIQAIRSKKIQPQMLEYNTSNTFYPSYILYHHFRGFIKICEGLGENNELLTKMLPQLRSGEQIGAIFEKMINLNFQKQNKVWLQNGLIKMSPNSYFYCFKTSPYIHVCCFQVKQGNRNFYVFVQIRNQKSQFSEGIQVRDLGATISPDYLSVGYRFNNVKPILVIQTKSGKIYRDIMSNDATVELGYSLQDLAQSLYITVKYTNMRVQFPTLEKTKNERPIGQYQAVTSRIADGFTTLFGLSFLRQRLINMPQVGNFMRFYLPFMHQIILERLVDLRQCCGGHGFLQMSGHPAFLQRVSARSAQPASTFVPQNKQVMKRVHYYSNDDNRQNDYLSSLSQKGDSFQDIFYYFIIICINMRKQKQSINPRVYMKQFLRQSCIQTMYSTTYFDPMDPTNPTQNLIYLIITKYVMQHSKYMNWSSLKMSNEQFHALLLAKKTDLLNKIKLDIPKLTDIMEVGHLRNVIVGDEKNSDGFYDKVMSVSENNKRNSPQYKKDILSNLITLIKQQRASL